MMIAQKNIIASIFFEDADVPMKYQLLKMIMKQSCNGKDGNINRLSLVHAMDGMSPFTMLDLNEDEVALLNDEQDLLNTASLVSVEDLRLQRRKLKICIPLEADDFMLMLKRYGNLLYAVFPDTCPLFKALIKGIRALRKYSREARKSTTLPTKGSILWIVLLQSRQFSLGEVNMLCEFTTMHEDLLAKKASTINREMPSELQTNSGTTLPPPERIKNLPHKPDIDVDATTKRQRVTNSNNWHPQLMSALKRPPQTSGSPTFTKIMNFKKKDTYKIFPKGSPVCAPNAFLELVSSTRSALKIPPRPWMHRSNLSWTCLRSSQKTPSNLMQVGNRKITTYLPRVISYVTLYATMS